MRLSSLVGFQETTGTFAIYFCSTQDRITSDIGGGDQRDEAREKRNGRSESVNKLTALFVDKHSTFSFFYTDG